MQQSSSIISAKPLAEILAPQYGRPAGSLRQALPTLLKGEIVAQWRTEMVLEAELPALRQLARRTLEEIQATGFTRQEITAIAAAFNGTLMAEQTIARPEIVVAQLADAETYDSGISNYGADPATLLAKLRTLTAAQAYYLLREVVLWWHTPGGVPDAEGLWKALEK